MGVYFTFNRDIHLLDEKEADDLIKEYGIYQILIGVDAATTRDATALIPCAVLNNGQVVVLPYFYHDPIKYGALDNSRLFPYIIDFVEDLKNSYEQIRWRNIPIHFVIDGANADLIQLLNYKLSGQYRIWAYTQKKVIQMAQIMQNAFSKNFIFIKDIGGIKNYISKNFEKYNSPLVTALESVIWDEKGKGFDDKIPNDTTDALTYALAFYFLNPSNLHFPQKQSFYEKKKKEVSN